MKRLFIIVAILAIFLLLYQPTSVTKTEEGVLISSGENYTVEIEQQTEGQIKTLSLTGYIQDATCEYDLYPRLNPVYRPEYQLFTPSFSHLTQTCHCPDDMYSNLNWDNVSITRLQYAYASTAEGQCKNSNCYTSGMLKVGDVQYPNSGRMNYEAVITLKVDGEYKTGKITDENPILIIDNMEIRMNTPTCTIRSIAYFNGVRDSSLFTTYGFMQSKAEKDVEYRIHNRDSIINALQKIYESSVEGCYYNGKIICNEKPKLETEMRIRIE